MLPGMGPRWAAPLGTETSGRFDSCFPDYVGVREQVNSAHCESVLGGIDTRTPTQGSRPRIGRAVS
jgi:hypothetical protein